MGWGLWDLQPVRAASSRAEPYLVGAAGAVLISAGIGLLRFWIDVPNLAVTYLLLVIWLSARHSLLPALATAILAFLTYEFFFVPPYETLLISAPRDLLDLLVLLLAAVLGGRRTLRKDIHSDYDLAIAVSEGISASAVDLSLIHI